MYITVNAINIIVILTEKLFYVDLSCYCNKIVWHMYIIVVLAWSGVVDQAM